MNPVRDRSRSSVSHNNLFFIKCMSFDCNTILKIIRDRGL